MHSIVCNKTVYIYIFFNIRLRDIRYPWKELGCCIGGHRCNCRMKKQLPKCTCRPLRHVIPEGFLSRRGGVGFRSASSGSSQLTSVPFQTAARSGWLPSIQRAGGLDTGWSIKNKPQDGFFVTVGTKSLVCWGKTLISLSRSVDACVLLLSSPLLIVFC